MRALDGITVLQQQKTIRQPSGKTLPIMVNAVPLSSPHWQSLGLPELSRAPQPLVEKEPLALVIYQNVRLLKEAEYLKDEFIGIAAHELRQPLTILKGMAETLLIHSERQADDRKNGSLPDCMPHHPIPFFQHPLPLIAGSRDGQNVPDQIGKLLS